MVQPHVADTLKITANHKVLIVFFKISLQAIANWIAAQSLEILDSSKQTFKRNF